ncbi:MAG: GntR family transcriptional regulator [Pseudomonadota bacterium]
MRLDTICASDGDLSNLITSQPRTNGNFPDIERDFDDVASTSMKKDIFETLQSEILEGQLQPGDRVKEAELAGRFGLSRTPIREALRRLETRGLLVHEPYRGMVVARLEASAIGELYVMREILDSSAARLAAQHATETEIATMEAQIARDKNMLDDPLKLAASNRAFHIAIYRAAHNRFLVKASDTLTEALALLGPTTLAAEGRGRQSIEEHEAIVAAIKQRDGEAASMAARDHIRAAFQVRLLQLDQTIIDNDPVGNALDNTD